MADEPLTYWDPAYVYRGAPAVRVGTADTRPAVNLTKTLRTLPDERRRPMWEALKRDKPELAQLLRCDETLFLMEEFFGGQLIIPEDDLPDSVLAAAGRIRKKTK